jgi:LysR family transcriptional regulator for bpeEF and oprC
MDRLDAMRLFVRLVECGSFSAVGREQGIGQPAVSKQIAALERHLGAQLVLRNSRNVVITDAGLAFYESARQLIDDFDAVEAPGHGRLCVTPLLAGFFQRYPQVAVEISVSERPVDLVTEGFDIAIRHGRLVDSSLTARLWSETDFVLVASPAYLATHGTPVQLADLDHHSCIVFSRGRERYPWRFGTGAASTSYLPRGALLTGDAEHVRAAVLCGLGIAQAPHWLLQEEIRNGQAQVLLPALQPERLPLNIVYAAGRRVPMRVRVLIDYLLAQ